MCRKNVFRSICILLGLLMLAGCAARKDTSALSDQLAGIKEAAQTSKEDVKPSEPEPEEPAEEAAEAEEPAIAEEVEDSLTAESLTKAFARGEVENNGNWFVRVGDQVFYRVFAKDGIERATIWGDIGENDADVQSELKCYDLKTNTSKSIATVFGKGKLFATADGFLLSSADRQSGVFVPVEGSPDRDFSLGYPVAVSGDGRYVATTLYPISSTWDVTHYIYHDGEEAYRITEGDDDQTTIFGFCGNDLIVMKSTYGEDRHVICSYDENGACTELGITASEQDAIAPFPEFEQMISDGNYVYFMLAYYEGTGHFLWGWDVYRASPGVAGSLTKLEEKDLSEEFPDSPPKIYLDASGELQYTAHPAGTVDLSDGLSGDLLYYETPEKSHTLQNFFSSGISNDPYGDVLQEAVAFDEYAFAMLSRVARDEAEDIGWRMAYDQVEVNFIVVPFGKEDLDEEGLSKHVTILDQILFEE